MDLGMIIFYDNYTGEVIVNTGEYENAAKKKSIEQLIDTYLPLKERDRKTFDYVELEYGQHREEFSKMSGYRVNVKDKSLIFSYQASDGTIVESDKPLIDYIAEIEKSKEELEKRVETTEEALLELASMLIE